MTAAVHLHQIAYSPAALAKIEPGYIVVDHLTNERSDWYEYWPIRRFLQSTPLDDAAFYGFFSPKFGSKTGLPHAAVVAQVQAVAERADVVLFSPQPDMGAFFLSVFEQAETFDPGFVAAASGWLAQVGLLPASFNLGGLVMDSRQIVYSNYFVARPAFWRAWLAVNETLFALCEGAPSPLRDQLNAPTSYPGSAQRKVFLMERTASLLMTLQPQWRTHAVNPYRMGWSTSRLREMPQQAVTSDALKMAYRDLGFPCYLDAFARLRAEHLQQPRGLPAAA